MVFDVGVSFSSSFPLSLPPPSLEVWMESAEEEGLQASILDSLGVAAPAVWDIHPTAPAPQTLRRLLLTGEGESVPQKNRGVGLMPAIRLGSGESG